MLRFIGLLFIILFKCNQLWAQQYDTLAANNCCQDRWLMVGSNRIFVPKNLKYGQGIFKQFVNYGWGYLLINENGSNKNCWPVEGVNYKIKDSLTVERKYHYLISEHWSTDTFFVPLDGVGQGFYLEALAETDSGLSSQTLSLRKLVCYNDTFCNAEMWGYFKDHSSGEELFISKNYKTVKYRSLKNPAWQNLFVFGFDWGFLTIGFSNNSHDPTNSYRLFYEPGNWILQGCKKEFCGQYRAPQFFKKH